MRRITPAAVLVVAAFAVACGTSAGAPPSGPTVSSTPSASSAGTPSTGSAATSGPAGAPEPANCAETAGWGTGAKEAPGSTQEALYLVRAGRHDCYDRVVFDINGPSPVGYSARYVPLVSADGSGAPIPVPGRAALEIVVRAPEQGFDESGHQPGRILAKTGDYFYTERQLAGWSSLRAVRFAGFFEGQCTFAVGVRDALPFRVFTVLDAANQVRHVVLDIGH